LEELGNNNSQFLQSAGDDESGTKAVQFETYSGTSRLKEVTWAQRHPTLNLVQKRFPYKSAAEECKLSTVHMFPIAPSYLVTCFLYFSAISC
jgi:hypothetical protein